MRRTPGLGGFLSEGTASVPSASEGQPETGVEVALEGSDSLPDVNALTEVFSLPRPYEAEELQDLVTDLERARDHHKARRTEFDRRLKALVQLEDDLEVRRREFEVMMKAVAAAQAGVSSAEESEAKLQGKLSEAELERLRPTAKAYERIKPAVAAGLLAKLPAHEAVKLLAVMRPRKVSKVLEAMAPEAAADLTRRLSRLERTQSGGGK
ncbi:MAG: hypothetical protein JKY65_31750 [Planctomycetes bacterium]|nr:hypothetical protein [Planctomycetota bacterium]